MTSIISSDILTNYMTIEAGGASDSAQDFVARRRNALYPVEFKPAKDSTLGVTYEPFIQLDEIGFSYEKVVEARRNQDLRGKVIVIVGAGNKGVGGAMAREISVQGATVAGVSRKLPNDPDAIDLMAGVRSLGSKDSLWIPADITREDQRENLIDTTLKCFGRIDGIVLAAAKTDDKTFTQYTKEELDYLFRVNLIDQVHLLQAIFKQFEIQREGRALIISSLASAGTPGQGPYPWSKAGLDSLVRGLPSEYILSRGKIAINSIAVGFVPGTPMTGHIPERQGQRIIEMTRASRGLLPQEVAEVGAFLLNPATKANGKVVPIIGRGSIPAIDERGVTIRLGIYEQTSLESREKFNFERFSNTPEYINLCADFVIRTLPVINDTTILDLAAGTGLITGSIREKYRGVNARIIGVDPNPVSLRKARERVLGDDKTRVGFVLGDGRELPLPSESVNFVYMGNAIHEIKGDGDKRKILEELYRVLTLDGTSYINSAFTEESYPNPRDKDLRDPSETRIWGWLKLYAIEEIPGATRNKMWGTFEVKKADEYKQMMEEAGFKDVTWARRRVEFGIEAIEAISEYDEFIRGVFVDVRHEDGSGISLEEGSRALKAAARRLEREYKEKHGDDAEFIFPRYWVEFTLKKELPQAA